MSIIYVLDASAVLAWIFREPGADRVASLMQTETCWLCSVNAAEIVSRLADAERPEAALRQVIDHIGAQLVPFDHSHATESGLMRPLTRHLGLSLGDRACLAVAKLANATAVTADRPWLQLNIGISIECIRP